MNAVARFFVRAKHWQVFIALVGPLLVAEALAAVLIAISITKAEPSSEGLGKFGLLIGLATAVAMLGLSGWLWFSGSFLGSIMSPALRLKTRFFLFSIVYPPIYVVLFGLFFSSRSSALLAAIFPLHFFAIFCTFYAFYFVSKSLALTETGRPVLFPDYAAEFFLIWFSFVGVWFIQPRINRLYEKPLAPPTGVEPTNASSQGMTPISVPPGYAPGISTETPIYAGFWLRFAAVLIDGFVTFFPLFIIVFVVTVVARFVGSAKGYDSGVVMSVALPAAAILAFWLYFSILESSPWQATIGKSLVGLYVSDSQGRRITLGRAMCRNLAKCLSNVTLGIGYAMCGFTKKKQTLHDILASCLVLRRPN